MGPARGPLTHPRSISPNRNARPASRNRSVIPGHRILTSSSPYLTSSSPHPHLSLSQASFVLPPATRKRWCAVCAAEHPGSVNPRKGRRRSTGTGTAADEPAAQARRLVGDSAAGMGWGQAGAAAAAGAANGAQALSGGDGGGPGMTSTGAAAGGRGGGGGDAGGVGRSAAVASARRLSAAAAPVAPIGPPPHSFWNTHALSFPL